MASTLSPNGGISAAAPGPTSCRNPARRLSSRSIPVGMLGRGAALIFVLGTFLATNRVTVSRPAGPAPARRLQQMTARTKPATPGASGPSLSAVSVSELRLLDSAAPIGLGKPGVIRPAAYVLDPVQDTNPDSAGPAADPVAGEIVRGAVRFPDSVYVFRSGKIYRGADVVGALTSRIVSGPRGRALSVPYYYTDLTQRSHTGDLLAFYNPCLEGSALQVGDEWWAFAAGAWVRLGKPLMGHTYPGFELAGGESVRAKIRELTRPIRVIRGRRHHRRRKILIRQPVIPSSDLEMLDRIAAVETSGRVDCVNTYDSGVVSFGIRQWTLSSGRLQEFINRNGNLFAPYGIAAYPDAGQSLHPEWYWVVGKQAVPRIYGVRSPEDLTTPYWTARFFRAGQDPRIILAELKQAARELYRGSEGGASVLRQAMQLSPYFRYSTAARVLLAELENNRPNYTGPVVAATLSDPNARSGVPESQFVQVLMQHMVQPYESEFLRRAARRHSANPDAARADGDRFAIGWMSRALHTSPDAVRLAVATPIAPPTAAFTPQPSPAPQPSQSPQQSPAVQ